MKLQIVEVSDWQSKDPQKWFIEEINRILGPHHTWECKVKFQRNLYYQDIAGGTAPDMPSSLPVKALREDYIAFILWEDLGQDERTKP